MSRKKSISRPANCATIETYERLRRNLAHITDPIKPGQTNGMVGTLLIGRGGTGKSEIITQLMGEQGHEPNPEDSHDRSYAHLKGRITSRRLYEIAYEYQDRLIVFDDINTILRDDLNKSLLLQITETKSRRIVRWDSTRQMRSDEEEDIPRSFVTRSKIVVITNDWTTASETDAAINTRLDSIYFAPSNEEVHFEYVPGWYDLADPGRREVYEFIEGMLDRIPAVHCRFYELGLYLRQQQEEYWRDELRDRILSDTDAALQVFIDIQASMPDATEDSRIRAFKDRGGGSRATFYRMKQRLGLTKSHGPQPPFLESA